MERAELRKAQRYSLSLPVTIHFPLEKLSVFLRGKTSDISTGGVYLVVEDDPGPGTPLNLTITIPVEITGGSEVLIHLKGKVVRVESCMEGALEKFGVAATIESYEMARKK
jgi:PilZ domain-containing protein